jgi:hypothetical protein
MESVQYGVRHSVAKLVEKVKRRQEPASNFGSGGIFDRGQSKPAGLFSSARSYRPFQHRPIH